MVVKPPCPQCVHALHCPEAKGGRDSRRVVPNTDCALSLSPKCRHLFPSEEDSRSTPDLARAHS